MIITDNFIKTLRHESEMIFKKHFSASKNIKTFQTGGNSFFFSLKSAGLQNLTKELFCSVFLLRTN